MHFQPLSAFALPYAGLATNLDRDLVSHDRTAVSRLARRVGATLSIMGLAYLGFGALLRYHGAPADTSAAVLSLFVSLLVFLIPGPLLRTASTYARKGGHGMFIFLTSLWTLFGLFGAIATAWGFLPIEQIIFGESVRSITVNQISATVLVLVDVVLVIPILRLLYHCMMLLAFSGRRVTVGGPIGLGDLFFMRTRRVLPGNALALSALLGKLRIFDGAVLVVIGGIFFANSIDWMKMPVAPVVPLTLPSHFAAGFPLYTGDIKTRAGLSAPDRKAAIDAICNGGMDPAARDLLDEALRWDGRALFGNLKPPIKTASVAAILQFPVAAQGSLAFKNVVDLPGPIRIAFQPNPAGGRLSVGKPSPGGSQYPTLNYYDLNAGVLSLRKLNADLDQINIAHPGAITFLQELALVDIVTQSRERMDYTASSDGVSIDFCELLADGTLKIRQDDGLFQFIDRHGSVGQNSPERQALIDYENEKAARREKHIDVAREAAFFLTMAGLLALLVGFVTIIRAAFNRPWKPSRVGGLMYAGTTVLMTAGLISLIFSAASRADVPREFLLSTGILGPMVVWFIWALTVGVVVPLRISGLSGFDEPRPPLCSVAAGPNATTSALAVVRSRRTTRVSDGQAKS